jgi:hypothetical protein
MRKPDGQTLFLGSALVGSAVLVAYLVFFLNDGRAGDGPNRASTLDLADIPFDGQRSYKVLQDLCNIGPRVSGSPGMIRQQELLSKHFRSLGGDVRLQEFRVRHPIHGTPVAMANLIVHWHPQRKERILLCAHYDTRPYPDRDPDPRRRRGVFIGANDGASGVALLAELAHHMPPLDSRYGVDFALFDGEEFVFNDRRDEYFLGSDYFARQYIGQPRDYQYRWGVLVDMVGDRYLNIYQEGYSVRWRDTRPLVDDIWRTARRLGVREFIARKKYDIRDDHLKLHDVAKIPTCNVIDFDFRRPGSRQSYWHTEADTADKCSAASLAKVGWVLLTWLQELE